MSKKELDMWNVGINVLVLYEAQCVMAKDMPCGLSPAIGYYRKIFDLWCLDCASIHCCVEMPGIPIM